MSEFSLIESIKNSDARNLFYATTKNIINIASCHHGGIIKSSTVIFIQLENTKFNPFEIHLLQNPKTLKKIFETIGNFSISDNEFTFNTSAMILHLENDLLLSKFRTSPLYICWHLFSITSPHD